LAPHSTWRIILTYNQARIKLYDMAREAGWDVSNPDLKVPWFITPKGVKVWLKKQSAYVGQTRPSLSTMYDSRKVHDFVEGIQEYPNH